MKLSIGHKLLSLREDRQLTQVEMADLLQIPDATYARYERNHTQVPYDKIVKFADLLKVPVQELLPDTMSINSQNHHHSGQGGGGFIFGNQNFYFGDNVIQEQLNKQNQELAKENKELRDKLESLESKIEELLKKMS